MTEPTLEQWKERALVAEALLEDRAQECESLRAELDAAKTKSGFDTARLQDDPQQFRGKLHDYQRQVMDDIMGGEFESYERLREQYWRRKEPMDYVTKSFKDRPRRGHEAPSPAEWAQKNDPLDRMKRFAPRSDIENVQVDHALDTGRTRVGLHWKGEALHLEMETRDWERIINSMTRAQAAKAMGDTFAEKLGMSPHESIELQTKLMDAMDVRRPRL